MSKGCTDELRSVRSAFCVQVGAAPPHCPPETGVLSPAVYWKRDAAPRWRAGCACQANRGQRRRFQQRIHLPGINRPGTVFQ